MKRKNITKDTIPEGFSISLAIVDFLPVIFFCFAILIFSYRASLYSYPIILGAIISIISGLIKVLWKIIAAVKKKNVWWMFVQMRIIFPIGFSMIIFGMIKEYKNYSSYIYSASFTNKLFFYLFVFAMILMSIFALTLDQSNPKSNWIEQITNSIAMVCLCFAAWI